MITEGDKVNQGIIIDYVVASWAADGKSLMRIGRCSVWDFFYGVISTGSGHCGMQTDTTCTQYPYTEHNIPRPSPARALNWIRQ